MQDESLHSLYLQSPRLNRLNILRQVAADPGIKQAALARRCLLSVAMVNNYMKDLCHSGLLEYRRKSIKTVSYYLTPLGHESLEKLQLELIQEMARLFAEGQQHVRDHILSHTDSALKRVVLLGSGSLARLAFHALERLGVSILGVCESDAAMIGSDLCGRQVLGPSQMRFMAPDAVVVADAIETGEISDILKYLSDRGSKVIRLGSMDCVQHLSAEEAEPSYNPPTDQSLISDNSCRLDLGDDPNGF